MRLGDPRFASYPAQPGAEQLRWYIRRAADGVLTIHEFLADFRRVHESVEHHGAPEYSSPTEARAIWDVLWAVEFCSPDLAQEANPKDWYGPDEVLAVVQRAARQLGGAAG
jgi:hypothetical protein